MSKTKQNKKTNKKALQKNAFTIDGVSMENNPYFVTILPLVQRIIQFLGKQDSTSFFTTKGLAQRLGVSTDRVYHIANSSHLQPYRLTVQGKVLYGSIAAIKLLQEQLAKPKDLEPEF